MALQSIWVHGSAVVVQTPGDQLSDVNEVHWTKLLGLRDLNGNTFHGHPGGRGITTFLAPIPTPCHRVSASGAGHCRLQQVGLKFTSEPGVAIVALQLADAVGLNSPTTLIPSIAVGPAGHGVDGRNSGWIAGRNYFAVPGHPVIYDALVIAISVQFSFDGQITFHAVGADFEVID